MILTIIWRRGEHHNSGTSASWSGLDGVKVSDGILYVSHLEGRQFHLDMDDIKEFEVVKETDNNLK